MPYGADRRRESVRSDALRRLLGRGSGGMKTKEIIEMLTCWSNDCHVWFDFDGHKANAAILLREAAHKLRENFVQEYEIENLRKLIADLKKELAERNAAPGWISVEERLPEIGKNVLIKYENDFTVGYLQMNNTWVCYYGNGWVTPANTSSNPTHWMPTPEPPKPPKKVKTYKDVFLEAFPNALTNEEGFPHVCRLYIFNSDTTQQCERNCTCEDCWNKPYFEEEGGE